MPPLASSVRPPSPPVAESTTMLPPAPAPPPPSLAVLLYALIPLAVRVAVPLSAFVRIIMTPPPADPLLAWLSPSELLRLPAPPPPPIATRLMVAGNATPPSPPRLRLVSHESPPNPPAPPLPPPPPPTFWSLPPGDAVCGSASVPPPPAFPGAPRAMLPSVPAVPLGYPTVVVVCRNVLFDSTHIGVPAIPSPLDPSQPACPSLFDPVVVGV